MEVLAMACFSHPAELLWGAGGGRKGDTSPFLRVTEPVQLVGGGVLYGGWGVAGEKGERQQGWEPAVDLQVSCSIPTSYCGRAKCLWLTKGKAFILVLMGTLCNLEDSGKEINPGRKFWPEKLWENSHQLVLMLFNLPHTSHPNLLCLNKWLASCPLLPFLWRIKGF